MADLFLHLAFARRLRSADGLHPLVGEAIGRRPALVCLGAALAHLPQNERKSMSFLRRLFSRGGEAARWQKVLGAAPPRVDLIATVLQKPETPPSGAGGGSMMRFATALGLLSADVLEATLGELTASVPPAERAGVERAQARLWLQAVVPNTKDLEREWRVVVDLGEGELLRNATAHVDRAIQRVHGGSPGEAVLTRWLKGLAGEVAPLVESARAGGAAGGLPASLTASDVAVKVSHFDGNGFLEKTQAAVARFVYLADRLAERLGPEIEKDAVVEALTRDGKLLEAPGGGGEIEAARARWKEWLLKTRDAALTRGRNPKPAFGEGEGPVAEQRLQSITKVLSLTDLPPEAEATGAPPVPEMSGPISGPPTTPPPEAPEGAAVDAAAPDTPAPGQASTADDFQAPAHTQEVSLAQIEEMVPRPNQTQPIMTADIVAESTDPRGATPPATTPPATTPPAATPPATPPMTATAAPPAEPTSEHTPAPAAAPAPDEQKAAEHDPRANGKAETPVANGEGAPPAPSTSDAPHTDPPRE